MDAASGLSTHELTVYLVCGLATCVSGLACLIFSWLRDDIRNLAASVLSLKNSHEDLRIAVERNNGILKGKGIIT